MTIRSSPLIIVFCLGLAASFLVTNSQLSAFAESANKPAAGEPRRTPLDFDQEVRPILAENCFKCHGFDEKQRMAGLRLDTAAGAETRLPSGLYAIKPGHLKQSELVARITDTGPLRMPPAGSGKSLTQAQITVLRRWVSEGAQYRKHWAFVAPTRPALPVVHNTSWCRNPIDRFILSKLESAHLRPSVETDRSTLLRRLSLDLIGLPPTIDEQNQFLTDKSPDAYDKAVNRLLASPHYGERMALTWLDLARYADTHGYHIDSGRDMWPWRNWVIDAYNRNLPYDQFTVQQLAGDLLPNATLDQKIATGFNRNHPIDFEGGAIPEEYAAAYIFDRIDTTATAFMGLTMRCGQCHDHKYDPISQKDYYRFFAFFHNVPENGLDGQTGNAVPFIKAPNADQQSRLDEFTKHIAALESRAKARAAEISQDQAMWEKQLTPAVNGGVRDVTSGLAASFRLDEGAGALVHETSARVAPVVFTGMPSWGKGQFSPAISLNGATYATLGSGLNFERTQGFSYGAWVYPASGGAMTVISHMDEGAGIRGWDLYLGDGTVYAHFIHEWEKNAIRVNTKTPVPINTWTHLFVTYDGSSKASGVAIYINGKPAELDRTHDTLTDSILVSKPAVIGRRSASAPFTGMLQDVRVYSRCLAPAEVGTIVTLGPIRQALEVSADKRTQDQKDALAKYYRENVDDPYKKLAAELAAAQQARSALDASIPTTMVMEEMPKARDTFILTRGQYDKPADKVTAGTPDFLPPIPGNIPANRFALARWLVSPEHPLTARVAVNRLWQQVFGSGLVKTSENFGIQGDRPSHPELLDWLAVEFMTIGWDQKAMMKLIVTSATYRQSSKESAAMHETDPENRLLSHAPRFRLPAEFVRDQALAVSGLLVPKIGGPSVKPYQTAGLWEELAFGGGFSQQKYVQDHGDDLYRRSMYTFWKRTCPPATLQTFDAPEREFCVVRRSVTDTPLQALALMNDPTYVEAARKLAERLMTECGPAPRDRLMLAYRLTTCRAPVPAETKILLRILTDQMAKYRKDPEAAKKLLSVGESPRNAKLDLAELAAWTAVCGTILNLDETISRS